MDRPVHHGNDGRNASSGWYQGCTKTINGEKNGDWDVIVKPLYTHELVLQGKALKDAHGAILDLQKGLKQEQTLLDNLQKVLSKGNPSWHKHFLNSSKSK